MSRRRALHCGMFWIYLGASAGSAAAQLPSLEQSPLNQIGRALGIGYGDGYHACPGPDAQPRQVMNYEVLPAAQPAVLPPPAEEVRSQLYERASMVPQRPRRSLPALLPVTSSSELHAAPDVSGGRSIAPRMDTFLSVDGASMYRQPMQPVEVGSTQSLPLPTPAAPSIPNNAAAAVGGATQVQGYGQGGTGAQSILDRPLPQPEDARSLIDLEPGHHPGQLYDYDSRMSRQSSSRRGAADELPQTPDSAPPTLSRQDLGSQSPPKVRSTVDLPLDNTPQESSPSDIGEFDDLLDDSLLPIDVAPGGEPKVEPERSPRQPVESSPVELPADEDEDLLLPRTVGAAGLNSRQMTPNRGNQPRPPRSASGSVNRYRMR